MVGERGLQGVVGVAGERGLQGVAGVAGERGLQGVADDTDPADSVANLVLNDIPGYIDSSRVNNLSSIPIWVNYESLNEVTLTGFGGGIPAYRVTGFSEQDHIAAFLLVDNQVE